MKILFFLIPFLFMNLNSNVWQRKMKGNEKGSFLTVQVLRLILGGGYLWLIDYLFLVDKTMGAFISHTVLPVGIILLIDSVMEGHLGEGRSPILQGALGVLIIIFFLGSTFVYPFTVYPDLYNLVEGKTSEEQLENIDQEHMIVVPIQYAQYKGEKLLGQLNNYSYYSIGDYTIQNIDNHFYWVAPIEFGGYFAAKRAEYVEAYIKISAEDIQDNAVLVDGYQMKYMPSGYFENNLYRRVRKEYPEILLMEASFEPDETGKPYYALSYGHYEKYRRGSVVDGIILFDPQSGQMEKYEIDKVPAFVDQVIPGGLAFRYNEYFGEFKEGFKNRFFTHRGVHTPTVWSDGEEVIGVFDAKGRMSWFTDHTTVDNSSTSMVGFSMMDARTGEFIYYTGVRGFLNGFAALEVANKTFTKENWVGAQPVLYNIYDQSTWVVPVIDGNGLVRRIALVHAETGKIVHAENKKELFDQYKILLANNEINTNAAPTAQAFIKEITGTVKRVNMVSGTDTIVKVLLNESNKIYNINAKLFPYAVFTQPGDQVVIKYIDNEEVDTTVKELKNLSIQP